VIANHNDCKKATAKPWQNAGKTVAKTDFIILMRLQWHQQHFHALL